MNTLVCSANSFTIYCTLLFFSGSLTPYFRVEEKGGYKLKYPKQNEQFYSV